MRLFDRLAPGASIQRHAHAAPYAAVVLSGGYEEAGDAGRWRVRAGDVLLHGAFSAHLNRDAAQATTVLNLTLPSLWAAPSAWGRVADADALVRQAERDPAGASARLMETLTLAPTRWLDEIDGLAAVLGRAAEPVGGWSGAAGVARETAWRRFRAAYGVGPARYRVEARARRAWRRLVQGGERLADIAAAEGFADQAHLTRDVRALTGRTPGQWRAMQHSFKTCPG